MCHENPSRSEKYWAGRHDTSMTDLKNMTHLVTSTLQKQTTTKAKTLDTRLCLEKKCHESEKCHASVMPYFEGLNHCNDCNVDPDESRRNLQIDE